LLMIPLSMFWLPRSGHSGKQVRPAGRTSERLYARGIPAAIGPRGKAIVDGLRAPPP
jgi:hypothetical protein